MSPKSPTGFFLESAEERPPDGVDIWLWARLKGIDNRMDSVEEKLDLVVSLQQNSVWAKVCEHAVGVFKNDNGQLKYITVILLGLAAILWSVPATLDATGVHLFANAPALKEAGKSR